MWTDLQLHAAKMTEGRLAVRTSAAKAGLICEVVDFHFAQGRALTMWTSWPGSPSGCSTCRALKMCLWCAFDTHEPLNPSRAGNLTPEV
jgi:hypothetical protein